MCQSHRRMKADEEWAALEAKLAGSLASWKVRLGHLSMHAMLVRSTGHNVH